MTTDEQTKKEECPRCEMEQNMMAISIAHMSCGGIEDDGKRGECMGWAADLDPAEIQNWEGILSEAYDKSGIEGLSRMPKLYNMMVRKTIITKIGDKLERGEKVTEEEQKLFTQYTKKEVAQGL